VVQGPAQRILTGVAVVAGFVLLAWMNGRHVGTTDGQVALYTVLGLVLAVLGLAAVAGSNLAVNTSVLAPRGYLAVWDVVARAFLAVLPFSLVALLAEFAYHWQAAPSFIQAALMTSGAAAGAQLMQETGRKARHLVVSMIVAFVFCALWIVLSYVFQRVAT
jgi:hypothetical protein